MSSFDCLSYRFLFCLYEMEMEQCLRRLHKITTNKVFSEISFHFHVFSFVSLLTLVWRYVFQPVALRSLTTARRERHRGFVMWIIMLRIKLHYQHNTLRMGVRATAYFNFLLSMLLILSLGLSERRKRRFCTYHTHVSCSLQHMSFFSSFFIRSFFPVTCIYLF